MIKGPFLICCLIAAPGWTNPPVTAAKSATALPAAVHALLDKEYRNWTFVRPSPSVQAELAKRPIGHPPSSLSADFDGDGRPDYAVQLALTSPGNEEQIVTVLLDRGGTFEESIIESRGLDPSVYLTTRKDRAEPGSSQVLRTLLVIMGGPTGDAAYGFENGSFHEQALPAAEAVGTDHE